MSVTIERVGFAPNYVNYVECLEDQYRIHDEVANRTRQNTIFYWSTSLSSRPESAPKTTSTPQTNPPRSSRLTAAASSPGTVRVS